MRLCSTGPQELELQEAGKDGLALEGEPFGAIQLLASSLLVCSARVLETYAKNVAKVPIDQLVLRVSWQLVEKPARVSSFELSVIWPELPEARLDAARRAALTCRVHKTLEQSPAITTRVTRG